MLEGAAAGLFSSGLGAGTDGGAAFTSPPLTFTAGDCSLALLGFVSVAGGVEVDCAGGAVATLPGALILRGGANHEAIL